MCMQEKPNHSDDPIDGISQDESQEALIKPRIHTTRYGTQSVSAVEIIKSEIGWKEIKQLSEANLAVDETE